MPKAVFKRLMGVELPRQQIKKGAKFLKQQTCGGIAQLRERLNGIQEVSGSIPLISTTAESLKKEQEPAPEQALACVGQPRYFSRGIRRQNAFRPY